MQITSFAKGIVAALTLSILPACQQADYSNVTVYSAQNILTQNPDAPTATAIAVQGDRITAIGDFTALKSEYKGAKIDTRFQDDVLVPGLIDPHVHMILGAMMYGLDFVPPWDMQTPKGTVKGLSDRTEFLAAIANFEAEATDGPLILYGYHNLIQGDLTRTDLDAISAERPIIIWHYSGHDFYLNSAALEMFSLTPGLAETYHGISLDTDGQLSGRIYEDALEMFLPKVAPYLLSPAHIQKGFTGYKSLLSQSGVTTVAEMGYGFFGRDLEDGYLNIFYNKDSGYRLYLVPEHRAFTRDFGEDAPQKIIDMVTEDRTVPILPQIKLFTDAAFYSQTMKMDLPGYIGGQSEGQSGLWVTQPETLAEVMAPYWDAGLDIHIHSNGDAAQTATLAAFETVQPNGKDGQRLIIEHAGLLTPDHLAQAAGLGVGISAASHYVHYMGDIYETAIGDKTQYITPLASALKSGLHVTLHSDAPLAPPQPLRAASVHMTRSTREGGVSTSREAINAEQALKAVTLDAAWSLGLEDEIGSLEVGKLADITVLGQNPLQTPGDAWPEIPIHGVMLGGVWHKNSD